MSSATVWHLSDDVLDHIFSFLSVEDVARAASVCDRWAQLVENPRVWRGRSYLVENGRDLSDALLVARALPVLKRVSVQCAVTCKVYLSGESAEFEMPELQDETMKSVISSLVTGSLSIDFFLLDETSNNCLGVQLHRLKQLEVSVSAVRLQGKRAQAKLGALVDTLSRDPLPDLQSVDITTREDTFSDSLLHTESDILARLAPCPALERLSIFTSCSLSWDTVARFSQLQVLELKCCGIEDISFLALCPNLRSLSLERCEQLRRREMSHKSGLRSVVLRGLPVDLEFADGLCLACPELERIVIDGCEYITHTPFLRHCPQLSSVEFDCRGRGLPCLNGLPSELRHLKLKAGGITCDPLEDIVKRLPRLEAFEVHASCIGYLDFLRHCAGLTALSVYQLYPLRSNHFHELGALTNLKKLAMSYRDSDLRPLVEVLSKLPLLEDLELLLGKRPTSLDISFLRHCLRVHSLTLQARFYRNVEWPGLRELATELANLKNLRKVALKDMYFSIEFLRDVLPSMPPLEELGIGLMGTKRDISLVGHYPQLKTLEWYFSSCLCPLLPNPIPYCECSY